MSSTKKRPTKTGKPSSPKPRGAGKASNEKASRPRTGGRSAGEKASRPRTGGRSAGEKAPQRPLVREGVLEHKREDVEEMGVSAIENEDAEEMGVSAIENEDAEEMGVSAIENEDAEEMGVSAIENEDAEASESAEEKVEVEPVVWDAAARMTFAQEVLAGVTMETFLPFKHVHFVKSAVQPKSYPPPIFPEVAVAGRSNVGKSSLLNSLFQRKALVKVSKTPGRTQLINFFELDRQVMLVDLPGYGFAQVPDAVRRQWQPMIDRYLTKREVLVACLFLLDIRRMPSQEDLELWEWLQHFEMDVIPVLTKADKLSNQQQQKQLHLIAEALDAPHQALVLTSAKDHKGRDRLRVMLRAYGWQAWQAYAAGEGGAALEDRLVD